MSLQSPALRCRHSNKRDSKRNFKKEKINSEEIRAEPTNISQLQKYTQEDGARLMEQGLEICAYMRNITIDREKLLVYGRCALPEDYVPGKDPNTCKPGGSYCPRHRVDPIGQNGCWHNMLIWGKRDYKPETESS